MQVGPSAGRSALMQYAAYLYAVDAEGFWCKRVPHQSHPRRLGDSSRRG